MGHRLEDGRAGARGVLPQVQAHVRVEGDEALELAGATHDAGGGLELDGGDHLVRAQVDDLGPLERAQIQLLGAQRLIGGGGHRRGEAALAVLAQAHEGEAGGGLGGGHERGGVDAGGLELLAQEGAELVVADPAHQPDAPAHVGQPEGDVGGGPADDLVEVVDVAQPPAAAGQEVDDRFTDAQDLQGVPLTRHRSTPHRVRSCGGLAPPIYHMRR